MRYFFKLLLLSAFIASPALGQRTLSDKIVAIIEEDIITLSELEEKASPFVDSLKSLPPEEFQKSYQAALKKILDESIAEKLIDAAVKENRQQLNISETEIDQAINEVQRMNNLSQAQLQAALYAQGMTWNEYREQIKAQMERSRLMQMKVQSKIQFNDSELKQMCQEAQSGQKQYKTCAAHILFVPKDTNDLENTRKKANKLRTEIIKGADFSTYADKYSADRATKGGALGCFSSGDMVQEFEDAAAKLQPGEASAPVQTQFGLHLIKVYERIEGDAVDCNTPASYQRYQQQYFQKAMQTQTAIWLDELRKTAHVEVFL